MDVHVLRRACRFSLTLRVLGSSEQQFHPGWQWSPGVWFRGPEYGEHGGPGFWDQKPEKPSYGETL